MTTFEPATITTFIEEVGQMGLSNCTCLATAAEGIFTPDDMAESTKDGLESVFHDLFEPPKMLVISAVNGVQVAAHLDIPTEVQPYVVSAKSTMQLLVVLKTGKYHKLTLCPLTPLSMTWIVPKNFEEQ